MTQEEKQLLLKDLCARFPYDVIVECSIESGESIDLILNTSHLDELVNDSLIIKPYLRPMSSMTKEEEEELRLLKNQLVDCDENNEIKFYNIIDEIHRLYLSHHIDFMGLIPKGLALVSLEDMYK